jgi:ABC-2 type transport system permease protein
MGKYLYLQLKRMLRIILPVILVATILFGCLALAYRAVASLGEDDTQAQSKIKMGVVGTTENTLLQLGVTALQTIDSSGLSIEFVEMNETDAESAMRRGDIAAFVVIPDGFVDAVMHGDILPIKYVSTVGAVGIVSLLKDEITELIEDIVVEAQKGTYGVGDAMSAAGMYGWDAVNDISIQYAYFIFYRSNMYQVTELGITDAVGLEHFLLGGLCVVFLMLICLVFAPTMVRSDMSLSRVLSANRRPVIMQAICDFAVYLIGILCVIAILMVVAVWTGWISLSAGVFIQWIPIVFGIGAMSFLLYELTTNLISGVLVQFFVSLAMCFISGCLYPTSFFPDSVQAMAAWLPTGIARTQLAESFAGGMPATGSLLLLGYGGVFFGAAVLIRKAKVTGVRG